MSVLAVPRRSSSCTTSPKDVPKTPEAPTSPESSVQLCRSPAFTTLPTTRGAQHQAVGSCYIYSLRYVRHIATIQLASAQSRHGVILAMEAKLDRTRSTSRRVRVLCTLYLTFGYLVYAIVLVLVVGYRNMGAVEWSGVAGGPVIIYAARAALAVYYNFRIDSLSSKLKEHQTERGKTIQKLKDATKYDSTLQLLEKYGGSEAKPGKGKGDEANEQGVENKRKAAPAGPGRNGSNDGTADPLTPHRTRLPPPPTANIQRGGVQTPASKQTTPLASKVNSPSGNNIDISAEFAPNAFGANDDATTLPPRIPSGQYVAGPASTSGGALLGESHWYDRILDLLMGDDETAARNRLVLICSSCRLVNGQAPPGTRSLAEVGSWRCMGCNAMNGEVAEAKKIVSEVLSRGAQPGEESDDATEEDSSDVEDVKEEEVGDHDDGHVATGKDTGDNKGARKRGKKSK
ncbi:hypothetical protein F503_03392 [Ophiostoma piceae UAMH 11346]|uniref:Endoplasmic reticulum junction formation protein lunapark n=1 Tax=Ophiostoma piceae (strain UAMH 11346) TaxID=1262450 RepID=S3D122_OPHP1|nr:hypothetical protein F503_03392 [Ophiostoma piceae UAMH 11346]